MERNTTHNLIALTAMSRISDLGVTLPIQQRIGAFVVCWGLFEAHLEAAIWKLNDEDVTGVRPSTDKIPVSRWIKVLGKGSVALTPEANDVLSLAAKASENLLAYRNSLLHGILLSFPGGDSISFLINPRWNGEIRKREAGDAHVDENLIDMAIESAWILFGIVICIKQDVELRYLSSELAKKKQDIARAKSFAGELRHLTALMNHEKY